MTGGEALCRALLRERPSHVFGVAGGKLVPFMKALAEQTEIAYLGTRHEASAALMAAAIHAGTGRIAVALGEVGPGAVNLAAGLAHAFNNNLAVLAITSNNQQMASYPSRGMFMEFDTHEFYKPITKWRAVVHDARRIPELVRRAVREATNGRPGPVHLDIPQDVMLAPTDFADEAFAALPDLAGSMRSGGDPEAIDRARRLLTDARRPLMIAGGGVIRSGASHAFRSLAGRLGAAVTATQMGLGAVADTMPGFAGHGGVIGGDAVTEACRGADVVLAVGCRFSSWMGDEAGALVRPPQKLIQIDIDPAVIGAASEIEVALAGDARAVLDQLIAAIGPGDPDPTVSDWRRRIDAARAAWRAKVEAAIAVPGEAMHPGALAAEIGRALPEEALVVYDGGHTSFWSNDLTPTAEPGTRFHDPGICQLGFGLPYGVALQAAFPGRTVVNITGDGAFGFSLQELDTARRYRLPVLTIIHNNSAWGVIRMAQSRAGFTLGAELDGTDYAAIARGFGCYGERITDASSVGPAIARALTSGLPAVLDCIVRFEPHPAIAAFGRMGRYGLE